MTFRAKYFKTAETTTLNIISVHCRNDLPLNINKTGLVKASKAVSSGWFANTSPHTSHTITPREFLNNMLLLRYTYPQKTHFYAHWQKRGTYLTLLDPCEHYKFLPKIQNNSGYWCCTCSVPSSEETVCARPRHYQVAF